MTLRRPTPLPLITLLIAALTPLGAPIPAGAADLMEFFRQGLESDPTYRAVVQTHKAAGSGVWAAWLGLAPSLNGLYERTEVDQKIKRSDNPVFDSGDSSFPVDEYRISLVMPIFRWEVISRVPQAQAEERQAAAELLAAEQDLMFRVSEAYLGVLAGQDDLAFSKAEREAIALQLDETESRERSGLATSVDVNLARARHAFAEATELESEAALFDRIQALAEITGNEVSELKRLQDEIPLEPPDPADVGSWVVKAKQQNLAVRASNEALTVARKQYQQELSPHLPSVDFIASLGTRDSQGTLFGGGSEVETTDLLVRVNIPIFDGPTIARTRGALHLIGRAEQDLTRARRNAERQARDGYQGVRIGAIQVRALSQSVASHESTLQLRRERLRSGLDTSLAVLDAQRDLFLVRRDHAQSRYDYLLNGLRLRQAAGELAASDLERISSWLTD